MNKKIFFSIIIPTYNRGHLIGDTIVSALNQLYSDYEILLIDDGSTDNTEQVVKAIQNPKLKYFKKENGERASARNFGVSVSKGDYVNFFDSDDFLLPNHLAEAFKAIQLNNYPEFIHLGYQVLSSEGKLLKKIDKISGDVNLRLVTEGNLLSCNGVFLRRDVAEAYPFIADRKLSGSEDHELWIRLASRFKIHHINVITSSIINHQSRSVLMMSQRNLIERLRLFKFYVTSDNKFKEVYGKYQKYVEAKAFTYISLHLTLIKTEDKEAVKYLLKGLKTRPGTIFTKRCWAILKHLILNRFENRQSDLLEIEKRNPAVSKEDISPIGKVKGDILFSVIIPTYNRVAFVTKAIESVINQKYINYEIIIIDDGSNDGTEELLRGFSIDKLMYFRIPNSERAYARNIGMKKAKGDYITFLDSDDVLYADYLLNAYESLKKYDYPNFFHLAYISIATETGRKIRKFIIKNDDILRLVKGNPLSCIGVFLKKEITDFYKFNEDRNLTGSEDWELWLRIAARYGLKTDKRISGALMMHESRSVLNYPEAKLVLRKNIALKYAFEDEAVREKYGAYKKAMEAYCDSYISLHLALSDNSTKAITYLWLAFRIYPLSIFDMRTIAIFKHILINIFRLRKVAIE